MALGIERSERLEESAKKPGQVAQEQAQIVAGGAQQGVDGVAHLAPDRSPCAHDRDRHPDLACVQHPRLPRRVALDVSIGGMMAVMTGIFLAAAFLFGPRYGLLAQAWRRGSQRYVNESRILAVHLYNHEDVPGADDENVIRALGEHLRWSEKKVREVVARSLRPGFVLQDGARLYLTARGRQTALELLEPWRVDAY